MEQDPAFAFRIVVDVAAKALSPAIGTSPMHRLFLAGASSPTTTRALRSVGLRLDAGHVFDEGGTLRLVYRTPNWKTCSSSPSPSTGTTGKDSIHTACRTPGRRRRG